MKVVEIQEPEKVRLGYKLPLEFNTGDVEDYLIYFETLTKHLTEKEIVAEVLEDFPYTLTMDARQQLIDKINEILLDQDN